MKHSMLHAFNEQMLQLDGLFQAALDDACKPEKIQLILTEAANRYTREAMESEVKSYFLYGEGRKHLAAKVKARMDAALVEPAGVGL